MKFYQKLIKNSETSDIMKKIEILIRKDKWRKSKAKLRLEWPKGLGMASLEEPIISKRSFVQIVTKKIQ